MLAKSLGLSSLFDSSDSSRQILFSGRSNRLTQPGNNRFQSEEWICGLGGGVTISAISDGAKHYVDFIRSGCSLCLSLSEKQFLDSTLGKERYKEEDYSGNSIVGLSSALKETGTRRTSEWNQSGSFRPPDSTGENSHLQLTNSIKCLKAAILNVWVMKT